MNEYVLIYKPSAGNRYPIHSSWVEVCSEQTENDIKKALKKHLYEPGVYTVHLYVAKALSLPRQSGVYACVTAISDTDPTKSISIGSVDFSYKDDTFENYDLKTSFPTLDPETDITSLSPSFKVRHTGINPSFAEWEIIIERSNERFLRSLEKAVDFPFEFDCDWPDVVFEICFSSLPDANIKENTLKVFDVFSKKYSKRHDEGIHYISEIDCPFDDRCKNALYIHVDFGDCDIMILPSLLRAINNKQLPIAKIRLR